MKKGGWSKALVGISADEMGENVGSGVDFYFP
jgi:hypothetical protein